MRGSACGSPFRPFKETETGLHFHTFVSPQTDETQRMVHILSMNSLRSSRSGVSGVTPAWRHDEHNSQGQGGEVLDRDPVTVFILLRTLRRGTHSCQCRRSKYLADRGSEEECPQDEGEGRIRDRVQIGSKPTRRTNWESLPKQEAAFGLCSFRGSDLRFVTIRVPWPVLSQCLYTSSLC